VKKRTLRNLETTEKHIKVAPAMHDTQDKNVPIFNTINDDVVAHGQAAVSRAKIFIAGPSDIKEAGEK
jgi:hypothetical protein